MVYCFDTSAVNQLHDDQECEAILSGLVANNTLLITGINVLEVCATSDNSRRASLLRLLGRFSHNRPLALPTEILQRVNREYTLRGVPMRVTISAGPEYAGLLAEPEKAGELKEFVDKWKLELEVPFRDSHRRGRYVFDELFGLQPRQRPSNFSTLIRSLCENHEILLDFVAPIYKRSTGKQLTIEGMLSLFRAFPEWPLYLFGWAHSAYNRAMRKEKYGAKGKPGTVDLWCAVYLCSCDAFVTSDRGQYRAMRAANVLNRRRKTEIVSYNELKQRLIVC
jgi:hypothetical protein